MITSNDFDRVTYPRPRTTDDRPKLPNIIGFDSEAYSDGTPFMFCTSLGDILKPSQLPDIFFTSRYQNANFVVYNLKYDASAILISIPDLPLKKLWKYNEVTHNNIKYQYIPHKLLRLKRKKSTVSFWDISQFYKQSLDRAAKFYLNEGKQPMPTKSFSRSYVKKNWMLIAKYCLRDADLTARLGRFLVDKLEEFGVIAPSLYSCASISYKYFSDNTKIVTAYDLWQNDRKALAMAVDSYEGGKFEITARGSFDAHEYDLTSAYPYEISNLIDISNATIEYSNKYISSPPYGFLRVIINNPGYHLPCGIMRKGVRIYPNGTYETTITKQEYEYLKELSIPPKIMEAVYFHVEQRHYPYRNVIDTLYKLKSAYKNKDTMLYNVTKIIQNSFYGKMAQCITLPDKSIRLGSGFNPIYASVITANTRIKVCRVQNKLKDQCLAVHTDSVITTCPINLKNSGLGEFEHVVSGKAIIIACGMYQINNQCAFKGFSPPSDETWETILSRPQNRNRKRIPYPILIVESWVEAMAKNHPKSKINLFNNTLKTIDLNPDTKRIWSCNFKARDFLTKNEQSIPLNFFQ